MLILNGLLVADVVTSNNGLMDMNLELGGNIWIYFITSTIC